MDAFTFSLLCNGLLVLLIFYVISSWQTDKRSLKTTKDQLDQTLRDNISIQQSLKEECALRIGGQQRIQGLEKIEAQYQAQLLELRQMIAEKSVLETLLQQERERVAEKLTILKEMEEKFTQTFKALSSEALAANNQSFLHLAQESFSKLQQVAKGDLNQKQQAIESLLKPVQETLSQVDQKIQALEKERVGAYEGLKQQIHHMMGSHQQLHKETSNLVKALRTPNVRGQWGEMQLKRVVEIAGMISHCDFLEQNTVEGEQGRYRPDMVINLPGDKVIVVDAKAPLVAYIEAMSTDDEAIRSQHLEDHARHVRNHIKQLSQRAYWDQFKDSPEFVVLFLPGETFFSAALEKDPSLIEIGVKEKVIMATPTTLIALLRAVSFGWRQEQVAKNAYEISELGKELCKRLSDMTQHFHRMGKALGQAVETYNQAIGTYERRVLVTARRFQDLDNSTTRIDTVVLLDHHPRQMTTHDDTLVTVA